MYTRKVLGEALDCGWAIMVIHSDAYNSFGVSGQIVHVIIMEAR